MTGPPNKLISTLDNSDLEIVLASPGEREDLIAELYYKERFVLQLSFNERGTLVVELPERTDNWNYIATSVPYELMMKGLVLARGRLEQRADVASHEQNYA